VRSTRAVRTVTRSTWPPKIAMGSELLRVDATVSTGAMMLDAISDRTKCALRDSDSEVEETEASQPSWRHGSLVLIWNAPALPAHVTDV